MPWIAAGEREGESLRHALQPAVEALEDRTDILPRLFQTRVPILQDDEGDARVGEARQIVENGDAAHSHYVLDAGDLAGHPLDLRQHSSVRSFDAPSGNCAATIT